MCIIHNNCSYMQIECIAGVSLSECFIRRQKFHGRNGCVNNDMHVCPVSHLDNSSLIRLRRRRKRKRRVEEMEKTVMHPLLPVVMMAVEEETVKRRGSKSGQWHPCQQRKRRRWCQAASKGSASRRNQEGHRLGREQVNCKYSSEHLTTIIFMRLRCSKQLHTIK